MNKPGDDEPASGLRCNATTVHRWSCQFSCSGSLDGTPEAPTTLAVNSLQSRLMIFAGENVSSVFNPDTMPLPNIGVPIEPFNQHSFFGFM